eukprot:381921-Pelagomonas_calceolata.AAC.3
MESPERRHWRVKEEDQRTRRHILAEASRPGGVSLLNFGGVHTEEKSGHTAHDMFGQIQVWRMLSRELSLIRKVLEPEVNNKLAQIQRVG